MSLEFGEGSGGRDATIAELGRGYVLSVRGKIGDGRHGFAR